MEWLALTQDGAGGTDLGADERSWLEAAQRAGHGAWFAGFDAVTASGDDAWVLARPLATGDGPPGRPALRRLSSFAVVWLRCGSPLDGCGLETSWLAEFADPARTLFLNHPAGLRAAQEHLYSKRFPALAPPTLVTGELAALRAFVARHGTVALRPPLQDGAPTLLKAGDPALPAQLAAAVSGGRCEARHRTPAEDRAKRLLVLDGVALGALTKPRGRSRRVRAPVEASDLRLVEALAPALRADRLHLVALDVVDGRLLGVDASASGLAELERVAGARVLDLVADWCTARAPTAGDEPDDGAGFAIHPAFTADRRSIGDRDRS